MTIGSTKDRSTCPGCGRVALAAPVEPHLCDVHQEMGAETCPSPLVCSSCGWRGCDFVAGALRSGDDALETLRRMAGDSVS